MGTQRGHQEGKPKWRGGEQMTETLADALPKEITRVRKLQDGYNALRGLPDNIIVPQIMIMEHEIQAAIYALASGDAVEMIRCHKALKKYEERGEKMTETPQEKFKDEAKELDQAIRKLAPMESERDNLLDRIDDLNGMIAEVKKDIKDHKETITLLEQGQRHLQMLEKERDRRTK